MKSPISHSAYNKYVTCPKQYDLHYNKRIRPTGNLCHLVFGAAMDAAFNALLLKKPETAVTEAQKELDRLLTQSVDFKLGEDYDPELLTDAEKADLLKECMKFGYKGDNVDSLALTLLGKPTLSPGQRKALSVLCRASLIAKAKLMIEAFKKEVLPYIDEVIGVQKKAGSGFIDMVVRLKGRSEIFVGDNKTAGGWALRNIYTEDAVKWSVQLADYAAYENVSNGLYVVFDKQIKKNRIKQCKICGHIPDNNRTKTCNAENANGRCGGEWIETIQPEASVRMVLGEISDALKKNVTEAKAGVEKGIAAGVFPRNLNACKMQYGKPCPYINYCWEGKMDGLEQLPIKKGNANE